MLRKYLVVEKVPRETIQELAPRINLPPQPHKFRVTVAVHRLHLCPAAQHTGTSDGQPSATTLLFYQNIHTAAN